MATRPRMEEPRLVQHATCDMQSATCWQHRIWRVTLSCAVTLPGVRRSLAAPRYPGTPQDVGWQDDHVSAVRALLAKG